MSKHTANFAHGSKYLCESENEQCGLRFKGQSTSAIPRPRSTGQVHPTVPYYPSTELITRQSHSYLCDYLIEVFLAYQALRWMRSGTMLRIPHMSEKGSKWNKYIN